MNKIYTSEDFESISFHDNSLYGISWKMDISDLILDIDYICDWICNKDKTFSFKVSPANLVFHNVKDFKMNLAWNASKGSVFGYVSIMSITRDKIENQKAYCGKSYYKWEINLVSPVEKSCISFVASGFTLTTRKEPILIDRPALPCNERE